MVQYSRCSLLQRFPLPTLQYMYDKVCPQAYTKHAKTHLDTEHTADTLWLIVSVSDRLLNNITKAAIQGKTIWKYYIYLQDLKKMSF